MPLSPTKIKKWKLLFSEDVSLSEHAPLEKRVYELPDGAVIDDFYVTTLADSVHIIPITKDKIVVMIRMYKPGSDEIMIQFPAGRFEPKKHGTRDAAAVAELAEETGIYASEADI
ncbi:MAG: NUDIX domain-containing protein [Pseudomonadales bacterium]|nr:NUDIX domain-containing protein [Candidatus Woesebacteria bacterium]MCB9801116.1 NUDIX domain-containing protein [Pseudomonadales bacterium]